MASFCIRQGEDNLTLGRGTSPYIVSSDQRQFPEAVTKFLNDLFITPDIQATYAALRQAEMDAVRTRQAWIRSLAESLQPQVTDFLENFPHTHPEEYL